MIDMLGNGIIRSVMAGVRVLQSAILLTFWHTCVCGNCSRKHRCPPLNPDPLDLIECDLVTGAVIELGSAGAFVRRHALGVFQRAAGVHVGGDPSGPEGMTVDPYLETHGGRA